jgi:hypothetical protein
VSCWDGGIRTRDPLNPICPPTGAPCIGVGSAKGLALFWSQEDSQVSFVGSGTSAAVWQLQTVNRDGTGESQIDEMPGLSFPTGFMPNISRMGTVSWVQLRPGRHELWMTELKR